MANDSPVQTDTGEGSAPCVGRQDELSAVQRALDTAAKGEPTVTVVVGEAGMGKSTLLQAAVGASEAVVVSVAGDEAETELDYGVVARLLRHVPGEVELRARADPMEVGALLLGAVDDVQRQGRLVVALDDAHLAD